MIANKLTAENKVPDFWNIYMPDGLKSVKPEAVVISSNKKSEEINA